MLSNLTTDIVELRNVVEFYDFPNWLGGIWLDIFSKVLWFMLYILIKLQFLPFQNTLKKNQ